MHLIAERATMRGSSPGTTAWGSARMRAGMDLVGDSDLAARHQSLEEPRDVALHHVIGGAAVAAPDRDLGLEPTGATAPAQEIVGDETVPFGEFQSLENGVLVGMHGRVFRGVCRFCNAPNSIWFQGCMAPLADPVALDDGLVDLDAEARTGRHPQEPVVRLGPLADRIGGKLAIAVL